MNSSSQTTSSTQPYLAFIYLYHDVWHLCTVSVHSGCCKKKILQTGWVIYNKNLFLTVLEAERPKSGHAFQVQSRHLTVSSHDGRGQGLFYKSTNPFPERSASWPKHPPEALPPNTITPSIRLSADEFRVDINVQIITHTFYMLSLTV